MKRSPLMLYAPFTLCVLSATLLSLTGCGPTQPQQQTDTAKSPASDSSGAQKPAPERRARENTAAPANVSEQSTRNSPFSADAPYPMAKTGFAYGPGRKWPRQTLDPQQPGPLVTVYKPETDRVGVCATAQAAQPLDAGPRENWAAAKAKAVLGSVLGGFLGGGGGSEPPVPDTVDNPLANLPRQHFDNVGEMELELAGKLTNQGLLINTHIEDAPGKPTFHRLYLERPNCQRAWPQRYLVYELWMEWSLSVSWSRTETRYRNGEQVAQHKSAGGFERAGTVLLGHGGQPLTAGPGADGARRYQQAYQQELLSAAPAPVWQQLGFNGPEAGVRELGAQFGGVNAQQLQDETVAILHIARPAGQRYITQAVAFRLQPQPDGVVRFIRL
ncbi:MAG: hypothetical protein OIF57_13755 [Marinobacterium sp.]|nr:hypothetical protein [Marinobacterium sp.]